MSEVKDAFLFSFYFNGLIKEGNDKDAIKKFLKRRLDCENSKLDSLFSGEEVIFKENIDFFSIVNLIKVFNEAGAGYTIKIDKSINATAVKNNSENPGERNLQIELEIELQRSKIEFNVITEKINYASK